MTHRSSFSTAYGGGRPSPHAQRLAGPERTFSDLFEYVDPGDVGGRGYTEHKMTIPVEDDDAPDALHVKYMGQSYKLLFPPYSISESSVTVHEVRRRMAEFLQQDPRRIRLVYKDRELRSDPSPIKKYGCKQNSEIAVVVTESFNDYGLADDKQSSGDDSGSGASLKPPYEGQRPRGLSTVRYRVEEPRKSRSDEPRRYGDSSGYLNADPRQYDSRRRSVSPGPPRDRPSIIEKPSTPQPPAQRAPPADPNTPMGRVQTLQNHFYDKWLPQGQQFLISPPSDAVTRDKEYRKLSESIMKHIIEAADAIELQGDQDARVERKRVLSDAQELLRKLDAIGKTN